MLKDQVHIYSLTDSDFYTDTEQRINQNIVLAKYQKKLMEEYYTYLKVAKEKKLPYQFRSLADFEWQKCNDVEVDGKVKKCCYVQRFIKNLINDYPDEYKLVISDLKKDFAYKFWGKVAGDLNKKLNQEIDNNEDLVRSLNPNSLKKSKLVSLFESDLTRTSSLVVNQVSTDFFIVNVNRYTIMDQLILNGFRLIVKRQCKKRPVKLVKSAISNKAYRFDYKTECYVPFTSSAGQIRTKKVLFIRESLKTKIDKTLMCGLTIEQINAQGGCNINKFLSYLALVNSATDPIIDFDINKAIVIDDFETVVRGEVDFINKKLVQVKDKNGKVIEEYWQLADKPVRKEMEIKITHSDGCGWVLPSVSKKNFMIRLPWIKGLMTSVDYLAYCKKYNDNNYKIIDIYGKEWDLKENNIQYVFTKSQFKMWKFYNSWEQYKENFINNNCHANYCNKEPDTFEDKRFNYQMLQTLTDISEDELKTIAKPTIDFIVKAHTDRDAMLDILGAKKEKKNKNYLQQALEIYPELINDPHVKKDLSETINARKREAKAGKLFLDCKYTFILPDVFAWMEYSLGGNKNPKGLLQDGEVYCKLYKNEPKLLVERSPHLSKEHAVRINAIKDTLEGIKKSDWFKTDGIYTSCYDLISKLLQFDCDGDRVLVVADKTLIKVAEKNMQDVVPLYYEMGTAKAEIITNESITKSLKLAFKYGNIGIYSNKITKLWNVDGEKDLELIKILCCINNFQIDAAKTLEMVKVSEEVQQKINAMDKVKLPYFYQFAKKKEQDKVAEINNSTVNRLCQLIDNIDVPVKPGTKNQKYDFSAVGKFNKNMLMNNPKIEVNDQVIDKYKQLSKDKDQYFMWAQSWGLEKRELSGAVYRTITNDFENFCKQVGVSLVDAVDMVIKHIYQHNRQSKKTFLFNCFGWIIVNNLKNNIKKPLGKDWLLCACCGERVKRTSNNQIMCEKCSKEKRKEQDRNRKIKNKIAS